MGLKSPALIPLLSSQSALKCQQNERGHYQWIIHSHSNFPAEKPYGTEVSLSFHMLPTWQIQGQNKSRMLVEATKYILGWFLMQW